MLFDDVILGRRSIRGYKPDPVPKELIAEIIGLAMRAPSSMNTQPWNFYVITGEPLDRIRAGNTERNVAGIPHSREFRTGQPFAGKHRDRQVGVAKQLFSAMGIERDNKDKRQDWVLRGFRQFDAPVSIVVTYDRVLLGSDIAPFDCGAVATALVAGLVTIRQRPASANGTIFLLLEDEWGFINVVVPSFLVEEFAEVVKFATFVLVQGRFEKDGNVLNVVGKRFKELSVKQLEHRARSFR